MSILAIAPPVGRRASVQPAAECRSNMSFGRHHVLEEILRKILPPGSENLCVRLGAAFSGCPEHSRRRLPSPLRVHLRCGRWCLEGRRTTSHMLYFRIVMVLAGGGVHLQYLEEFVAHGHEYPSSIHSGKESTSCVMPVPSVSDLGIGGNNYNIQEADHAFPKARDLYTS